MLPSSSSPHDCHSLTSHLTLSFLVQLIFRVKLHTALICALKLRMFSYGNCLPHTDTAALFIHKMINEKTFCVPHNKNRFRTFVSEKKSSDGMQLIPFWFYFYRHGLCDCFRWKSENSCPTIIRLVTFKQLTWLRSLITPARKRKTTFRHYLIKSN